MCLKLRVTTTNVHKYSFHLTNRKLIFFFKNNKYQQFSSLSKEMAKFNISLLEPAEHLPSPSASLPGNQSAILNIFVSLSQKFVLICERATF